MAPSKLTARVCNLHESKSTYKESLLFLVSGLLVKRIDNTIHWRNKYQLDIKVGKRNCSIHWIVIYPVHIEQTEPDQQLNFALRQLTALHIALYSTHFR